MTKLADLYGFAQGSTLVSRRLYVLMAYIVGLFISLISGACGGVDEPAPVQLRLGYRPTVIVDLGLLKAVERGEFAKAGLQVELQPFGRADLLFAALKTGQIDGSLGVPLEPILGMATQGAYPYRGYIVWYFDASNPYDAFVVRKDSTVERLDDLASKAVGSHPSRQVTHFVSVMLPHSRIQQYNPAAPLLPVLSGDLEAAYVLEPIVSRAAASDEFRVIEEAAVSRLVFNGARVPAALSLLREAWIHDNPEAAAQFVRFARKVHRTELQTGDRAETVRLLSRKEYGGYPPAVASRVVEPASSFPEELSRDELDLFFEVLRQGNLLAGQVDFDRLLYVPPGT